MCYDKKMKQVKGTECLPIYEMGILQVPNLNPCDNDQMKYCIEGT